MSYFLRGAFWIGVYLGLVFAPLFALLAGPTPAGAGFWWDFSIALGFAALAMMLVQFVLTARFRRATAPYGIDIIYYFHRYLAVVGFVLLVAHPLILIWDTPAMVDLLDPRFAPWYMTAGTLSLVTAAVVIATSLWRKPLRMSYDFWRVFHSAVAVAAVGFGLLHMHGVGYYTATPGKRALWLAITSSWLWLVLHMRVLRPWQLLRRPWRVTEVRPERGNAWTVTVEPEGHDGFRFEPGQFAWLTLRASPFAMKEHPFSIASSSEERGSLRFTIKELGDFTRTIGTVRPGETAYVDAPYGAFSIDRTPEAPGYAFIAGGIGIAPMICMLRTLADRGDERPHLLIYATSTWERTALREELEELKSRLSLRVVHVLEEPPPDWQGERGRVTLDLLERHLPADRARHEVFICGPTPMIDAVEKSLYATGVPMTRSHSELFDLV
jgi:predicted ferric reductase